MLYTLWERLLN